jgi:beta-glucanase (GH16 family)
MVTTGPSRDDRHRPARFAFQYGYVEMRARVPAGQGLWSALWLLPSDQESKPEIDIMEVLGHEPETVQVHLHTSDGDGRRVSRGQALPVADLSTGWHTYALNWRPDALVWFVDGQERWRVTDPAEIPTEPMYLLANLAVGGDWPGSPDETTSFPNWYEIDYVRVWQTEHQPSTSWVD